MTWQAEVLAVGEAASPAGALTMRINDIELTILVKGRPITEYPHNDQVFVEGRAGSEYELEVRNHSSGRIEAVLSVDGLSVLDGKLAGAHSRGYLISSRDSVRVPGWTLDMTKVAKFAFAGKQDSYATQMTGDSRNNGVIGVMAYREKIVYFPNIYCSTHDMMRSATNMESDSFRGIAPSGYQGGIITPQSVRGIERSNSVGSNASISQDSFQQSLGTAFGEAQGFATRTVAFERAGVICVMVVGYDSLKGLRSRGIPITNRRRHVAQAQPNAFPGMHTGCIPPPTWNG